MIIDSFLNILFSFLQGFISFLPTYQIPLANYVIEFFIWFSSILWSINWIFPVSTFIFVFGVVITVESSLVFFKISIKIINFLLARGF